MSVCDEIAGLTVSLDRHFSGYQFIHSCLGQRRMSAGNLTPKEIYKRLRSLRDRIGQEVADEHPTYRRTYLQDFVTSVITQMEHFIFRKRIPGVKEVVEKLYGMELLPPFRLAEEYASLLKDINATGSSSVIEFRNKISKNVIRTPGELKAGIREKIRHLIKIADRVFQPYFGSLYSILDESAITIEINKKEVPPCYYFHEKGNRGTAGIRFGNVFRNYFFEQFICHELIPGHHFYYSVKSHLMNTREMDRVFCLDTYYSPENIINEGLATNADMLLRGFVSDTLCILMKIEKFYHKVIYNCWHETVIEGKGKATARYRKILTDVLGEPESSCEQTLEYFLKKEKLYTPCYPSGIGCVESFIREAGIENLPFLYLQHSANSMNKFINHVKGAEK